MSEIVEGLFKVKIREDIGLEVKDEAKAVNGWVHKFKHGWVIEEDDSRYPNEVAMIPDWDGWPLEAPIWISIRDLIPVDVQSYCTESEDD